MKKISLVCLVVGCAISLIGGENLIKNYSLKDGLKYFYIANQNAYSLSTDDNQPVIKITGSDKIPQKRLNFLKLQQNISVNSKQTLANQKATLSFDAKVMKLSGKITVSIRAIDKENKSIKYYSIVLTPREVSSKWKTYTKEYTLSPKTVKIAFYIITAYPKVGDEVLIKNPSITLK